MFDLGALWMPIKYDIPMLILMYNNRAYYNDWAHQIHMAHQRGTDPARAYIGMDLEGAAARLRPYRQGHRLVRRRRHRRPGRSRPGIEARHRPSQSRQTGAGRRRRLAPRRECLRKEFTAKNARSQRRIRNNKRPEISVFACSSVLFANSSLRSIEFKSTRRTSAWQIQQSRSPRNVGSPT